MLLLIVLAIEICWCVLFNLYSVGMNVLYSLMACVNHGLVAVKLGKLYPVTLFLSSGIVLMYFSTVPC
jgi:hypothetical protein